MGFLATLYLPILLSSVFVFIASSLVHMVVKWHASDYGKLPDEDKLRAAFRASGVGPGQFVMPNCSSMKDLGSPEMHINVDEVDADTRRFYERHGFVNIEEGADYRMLCYIGPTSEAPVTS